MVVERRSTLSGSNTDAFGFLESLKAGAPHWQAGAGPAVVLGAGGAARAVLVALIDAGVQRDPPDQPQSRARAGAEAGAGRADHVVPWRERDQALAGAALLVNTTSLGMTRA